MKLLMPLALISAAAFSVGALNLWSDADLIPYNYVDNDYLGGVVEINVVEIDEDAAYMAEEGDNLELRVKLTGAGSMPENSSAYFIATAEQGGALPAVKNLKKTDSRWVLLPNRGPNPELEIEVGNRQEISGKLMGYKLDADAAVAY